MKYSVCALSLVLALCSIPFLTQAAPSAKPASPKAPAATTKAVPAANEAKKEEAQQKGIIDTSYQETTPLELVKNSKKWMGEKVSFQGTFVTFSPFALDYKGALRESKDYVAFLIKRPDAPQHVIPLSELKLIYPRKEADSVMDLENGDDILIKGTVFSAALGDPWVDVQDIVILHKNPESEKKAKEDSLTK